MLNLDSFNTSSVKLMNNLFLYDGNLTSIDLRHFDTHNVNTFEAMFEGCKSLRSIDMTNFDLKKDIVFYNIFNNCENLTVFVNKEAEDNKNFMEAISEDININFNDIESSLF